jgi:hydroxymethylpyrimidine/phosphomethylpyrimidine kinase
VTPAVVSIGTTDPWNAAGLGLDARVMAEYGLRPLTIVAAVSAQDGCGLRAGAPVDAALIRAQWDALAGAPVAALRIGALMGAAAVREVAAIVRAAGVPAVYDPVVAPSRGGRFVDAAAALAIRAELLPAVTVCTPNLAEAAELAGVRIASVPEMIEAARTLRGLGARAVLVTGGHLPGEPVDVLIDDDGDRTFTESRLAADMRGSGCVLASALAAELARGAALRTAVGAARAFVRKKIAGAVRTGDFLTAY